MCGVSIAGVHAVPRSHQCVAAYLCQDACGAHLRDFAVGSDHGFYARAVVCVAVVERLAACKMRLKQPQRAPETLAKSQLVDLLV